MKKGLLKNSLSSNNQKPRTLNFELNMIQKILIGSILLLFSSCKHKYHCNCATSDPAKPTEGFVFNPVSYDIKDKNKDEGQISCAKKYIDEGNAIKGVECKIE